MHCECVCSGAEAGESWSRRTGLIKEKGCGGSGGGRSLGSEERQRDKRSFTAELGERKEVPERDWVEEKARETRARLKKRTAEEREREGSASGRSQPEEKSVR